MSKQKSAAPIVSSLRLFFSLKKQNKKTRPVNLRHLISIHFWAQWNIIIQIEISNENAFGVQCTVNTVQCATSKKKRRKVLSSIHAHLFFAATKSVNRAQRATESVCVCETEKEREERKEKCTQTKTHFAMRKCKTKDNKTEWKCIVFHLSLGLLFHFIQEWIQNHSQAVIAVIHVRVYGGVTIIIRLHWDDMKQKREKRKKKKIWIGLWLFILCPFIGSVCSVEKIWLKAHTESEWIETTITRKKNEMKWNVKMSDEKTKNLFLINSTIFHVFPFPSFWRRWEMNCMKRLR